MICDAGFPIRLAPLLGFIQELAKYCNIGPPAKYYCKLLGEYLHIFQCNRGNITGAAVFCWMNFQKVSPAVFLELNAQSRFF